MARRRQYATNQCLKAFSVQPNKCEENDMKLKLIELASAAMIGLTAAAIPNEAEARWRGGGWWIPGAVVGGLALGAAIASRPYYYGPGITATVMLPPIIVEVTLPIMVGATTTSNRIRITATDIGQSTNRTHRKGAALETVRPFGFQSAVAEVVGRDAFAFLTG